MKTNVLDRLISLFGLDEFGWETMSDSVKWTLRAMTFLLASVFVFEFMAWSYGWYLRLKLFGWAQIPTAVLFGAIFAGVALLLNIAIVSRNEWRPRNFASRVALIQGLPAPESAAPYPRGFSWLTPYRLFVVARVVIILGLALFMAGPVSQLSLYDTTNVALDKEEGESYQRLVDAEVQRVTAQYKNPIDQAAVELQRDVSQINARVAEDVANEERLRSKERAELIAAVLDPAVKQQEALVTAADEDRRQERNKPVGGRIAGAGKVYRSKNDDFEAAQRKLQDIRTANAERLTVFGRETARRIKEKNDARDEQITRLTVRENPTEKLNRELRDKIAAIKSGPRGTVRGEWKVARDYQSREKVLDQLEKVNPAVARERRNAILLMMLLNLGLLLIKFLSNHRLSPYYDPLIQAAEGNPIAIKLIKDQGISNPQAAMLPDEVLVLRYALIDARESVSRELEALDELFRELARPLQSGLYRTRASIEHELRRVWHTQLKPKLQDLHRLSARAAQSPFNLSGIPPIASEGSRWLLTDPWIVTEMELAELGWIEPSEEQRMQLAQVLLDLTAARNEFDKHAGDLNRAFELAISLAKASVPIQELTRQRRAQWLTELAPLLSRAQQLEDVCATHGVPPPPWLPVDPRVTRPHWELDEDELRSHGWTGTVGGKVPALRQMMEALDARDADKTAES